MKHPPLLIALAVLLFAGAAPVLAQQTDASSWEVAQDEIRSAFGFVPDFFDALPERLRAPAWNQMKALNDPNAAIPAKYRELIALAVAAQIPCSYCTYAHTEQARALGAAEAEIKEAIAQGAIVRQWSTILNGSQLDLNEFRKQWSAIIEGTSGSGQ